MTNSSNQSFLVDYFHARVIHTLIEAQRFLKMPEILRPIKWFYHEFGIDAVHKTGRNAYFIILARSCRMFAFGTNSLILGKLEHVGSHGKSCLEADE